MFIGTYHPTIFLYPYPHQIWALIMASVVMLAIGLPAYGIYRLIVWKMNQGTMNTFNVFLKIAGIAILIVFFTVMTIDLITIHHVNKQLGFAYATPDTPEGERFLITKVVPGTTMHKAGLITGDQVQMSNVNNLYQLLINNQNKEVVIHVLRNKKKHPYQANSA